MRVHLYAVCWNEVHLLDFFFRHYAPWVDRFVLLDDASTDGTREDLDRRPNVAVETLVKANPASWVDSSRQIYDAVWKRSRGTADWVVLTHIDEHIHHPGMRDYLHAMLVEGVTVIPTLGYQMIVDDLPEPDSLLWRDHPMGAPWEPMSRLAIFRPDMIAETNFAPGRHRARFEGTVEFPEREEVANLHYKYMGVDRTQRRHETLAARLGETDRQRGWGHKYHWPRQALEEDFERLRPSLVDTSALDHHTTHGASRWWRTMTSSAEGQ